MKYLKTYEKHYHNKPNEGDYVICKSDDAHEFLNDFYQNTIGKIISVNEFSPYHSDISYKVQYDIPEDKRWFFKQYSQVKKTSQIFDIEEVLHFSKNREYLETILAANKYNL